MRFITRARALAGWSMSLLLVFLLAGRLSYLAPWNEYAPSTLEGIIEEHRALLDDANEGDYVLDPGFDRHRVRVRYLGKSRPIHASRRAFLGAWTKAIQISPPVEDLFHDEILVEEGPREYWVPVQKALIPALER